jgi:excisionase family DNA binding protein
MEMEYLKLSQIAEMLNVHRLMVYRLVAKGEFPVIYLSRRCIRVPRREFEEWLASKQRRKVV